MMIPFEFGSSVLPLTITCEYIQVSFMGISHIIHVMHDHYWVLKPRILGTNFKKHTSSCGFDIKKNM